MQKNTFEKNKKSTSKSYSNLEELSKKNILGVGVTDDTKENILEYILNSLEEKGKSYYIVTPNPEIIVAANKNKDFKNVLNNAKLALNDGVGVGLAASLMGNPLKERFTGVELVEKLCEESNDWPITVGFLGAGPNVAEKAAKCLKQKYPKLQVVFAQQEWDEVNAQRGFPQFSETLTSSSQKDAVLLSEIRHQKVSEKKNRPSSNFSSPQIEKASLRSKIDILFVAFGAPKQEFWMHEHLGKIPVKVMVGVGGALDQIVDPSLRSPQAMQAIGLGWLYRLIRQPWRIKRQMALVEFVGMVLREVISKRR